MPQDWAVILCGGRGARMGDLTKRHPKPMLRVHDRPIIWFVIASVVRAGVRNIIFPLGYGGESIQKFVESDLIVSDVNYHFIDTGRDTPIGNRLDQVVHLVPDNHSFLLINGDTIFDFDLAEMAKAHQRSSAMVTLSSVQITSAYGLIIVRDGEVLDFTRDSRVEKYVVADGGGTVDGHVNAGICYLQKESLFQIDFGKSENFEADLYPQIIRQGGANLYHIKDFWYSIDTPKDLAVANDSRDPVCDRVRELKIELEAFLAARKQSQKSL